MYSLVTIDFYIYLEIISKHLLRRNYDRNVLPYWFVIGVILLSVVVPVSSI